jgi:hypothetical protein
MQLYESFGNFDKLDKSLFQGSNPMHMYKRVSPNSEVYVDKLKKEEGSDVSKGKIAIDFASFISKFAGCIFFTLTVVAQLENKITVAIIIEKRLFFFIFHSDFFILL